MPVHPLPLRAAVRAIPPLAMLVCAACGGEQAPLQTAPLVFSGAPAETATSKGGQLRIDIRWSWSPPVVGYDASEMTITDGTGAPATGLTLAIVPWMPAHGHSASVAPTVSESSPGVYVAAPLDFYMSGTWQLLTTITGMGTGMGTGTGTGMGMGSTDDSAQPSVDIP